MATVTIDGVTMSFPFQDRVSLFALRSYWISSNSGHPFRHGLTDPLTLKLELPK